VDLVFGGEKWFWMNYFLLKMSWADSDLCFDTFTKNYFTNSCLNNLDQNLFWVWIYNWGDTSGYNRGVVNMRDDFMSQQNIALLLK
jgi:hypothetical protein